MPGRFPEEVDVFTIPHSRMKYLVNMYLNQLSTLDFTDPVAMPRFLSSLLSTFKEFQQHEQIENRFIMDRLKRRLSALSVYNPAVCNCHQDNRLTEMMGMLTEGLSEEKDSQHERDLFSCQLHQKLNEFTDNFLPHMKEEEEIFQPLLIKYFGYDELRELKLDVLQNHHHLYTEKTDQPKETPVSVPASVPAQMPAQLLARLPTQLPSLPPELLPLVFRYLAPSERAVCAAVCRTWRTASMAPELWRCLGPFPTGVSGLSGLDAIEALMTPLACRTWDLDADEDECDPGGQLTTSLRHGAALQRRTLKSMTRHTLPLVGQHVQTLQLAGCLGLGSSQLRQLLIHCPNVRHMDVSYTGIGDCSFKRLPPSALQQLQHCDLSGCERLTDRALERLAVQLDLLWPQWPPADDIEEGGGGLIDRSDRSDDCYDCESRESCGGAEPQPFPRDKNGRLVVPTAGDSCQLRFLSLSGCRRISSAGVLRLAATRAVASLQHLDVSGCGRVSGAALHALAAAAPRLSAERLWYCDLVRDGPHPLMANGCDNVQCPIRYCCRN